MSDELKYTDEQLENAKNQAVERFKESQGKIYAQSDVDNIVEKAKRGELERFKESDEYKSLLALKESNSSNNYDELNSKYQELLSENNQLKTDKENYSTQMRLLSKGVDASDIKYVMLDLKESEIDIQNDEQLEGYLKESKFMNTTEQIFDSAVEGTNKSEYTGIFIGKDD